MKDSQAPRIAFDQASGVLCTPDSGTTGGEAYSRRMLNRMSVGKVQLPDGTLYVLGHSEETMRASEWGSLLSMSMSIVDGSLNLSPLSDLDQVYLIEMFTGTSKYHPPCPPCNLPPPPPPGDCHSHVFLVNMYCAVLCCPFALHMALHLSHYFK